jgi:hypothetical protein
MSERRGLYPRISREIEEAVRAIVARHRPEIRKRKDSRDLLNFWIVEGASLSARLKKRRVFWRLVNPSFLTSRIAPVALFAVAAQTTPVAFDVLEPLRTFRADVRTAAVIRQRGFERVYMLGRQRSWRDGEAS